MTKIMFSSCCFFYSRADTRSRQAPANRPLKGYRRPSVAVGLFVQQIEGPRLGKRTVARTGMARIGLRSETLTRTVIVSSCVFKRRGRTSKPGRFRGPAHQTLMIPRRLTDESAWKRLSRSTPGTDNRVARFGPTTPKRAGRLSDASVDQTEARNIPASSECRIARSFVVQGGKPTSGVDW
jgi:hypothetical protein